VAKRYAFTFAALLLSAVAPCWRFLPYLSLLGGIGAGGCVQSTCGTRILCWRAQNKKRHKRQQAGALLSISLPSYLFAPAHFRRALHLWAGP